MTSEKNWNGKGVEHTHHVEIVVAPHRADVVAAPYILGVFVILVADVRVGQLQVDGLLGWELLSVHFLPGIHILVRLHPLAYQ